MGYQCDSARRCENGNIEKFIRLAIVCLIAWLMSLTDAYCEAPKVILSEQVHDIKLRGVVVPLIEVKPLSALFFSLYEGQTKEGALTIVNNGDRPIRITGTESGSRRFVMHVETITEGREYRLLVKVEPKVEPGRTKEKVILFTDDARVPRINVGVNIFIKKDVYYFPDEIDFGAISTNKLKQNPDMLPFLTQAVLVKRREGKGTDFQIRLENDIPFIHIKKEPDSGSETYRLDVSLVPEKMIPGKIDTFIKVITNDKEVPELKIPVIGTIN